MRRLAAALLAAALAGCSPEAPLGVGTESATAGTSIEAVRSVEDPTEREEPQEVEVAPRDCWLARHQSADGSWDPDPAAHPCGCLGSGARPALGRVGTTGLALLAFLAQGETHRTPRYGKVVRAGLKFLKDAQREDGCFGAQEGPGWVREHALGALAMTEACAMAESPLFRSAAQRGVEHAQRLREHGAGWTASGSPGPSDIETTAWMVMLLRSGRVTGLSTDSGAFREVQEWIDREFPVERLRGDDPVDATAAGLTRIAMVATARWFCAWEGAGERDSTAVALAEHLARRLPTDVEGLRRLDGATLYFGSFALFQEEDALWLPWRRACWALFAAPEREDATRCDAGIFRSGRADESPIVARSFAYMADHFGHVYRRHAPRPR